MILNKNFICFFFTVLLTANLCGQEEKKKDSIQSEKLDEVVITATRTKRQLSSLPLPVTLIGKDQIQNTGVIRLNEILNEQTGIIMVPDFTVGGLEGVQIQGIASDYIMILIDGVPVVGRSSGNLDLSRLAVGNIKQIEVVKGPSSSLFGSEALGGIINIITEKPKSEEIKLNISHRSATFNSQNTNVELQQRLNKVGYTIFADRLTSDGFDITPNTEGASNSPFTNYTVHGKLFFDLSDKLSIFSSARFYDREFDVTDAVSEDQEINLHARADYKASELSSFEYELYYTNYKTKELAIDPIDDDIVFQNDFDQKLLRPEIRFSHKFSDKNTFTTGVGYNFESVDRTLFAEEITFDSQYVYAQYDFQPFENLNVIAGARFDNHSEYQSQFSPKFSLRYKITDAIAVKGSVGYGFKAPDFRQLYLDFTNALGGGYSVFGKEVEVAGLQRLIDQNEILTDPQGNPRILVPTDELGEPLRAESSVGINFGVSYKKNGLTANLNAFRNDFKDLIDTRVLATKTNGANVFGYTNFARVYTQGLELDLSYKILQNLRLSGGYQLLYAYDKEIEDRVRDGAFARDPQTNQSIRISSSDYFGLVNRSRHTANLKIYYDITQWDVNANVRVIYRSKYGLTDSNGNDFLDVYDNAFVDGFALINATISKRWKDKYTFQIGANNLFNFKGTSPLSQTIAGGTFNRILINPGRQIFGKINIQI